MNIFCSLLNQIFIIYRKTLLWLSETQIIFIKCIQNLLKSVLVLLFFLYYRIISYILFRIREFYVTKCTYCHNIVWCLWTKFVWQLSKNAIIHIFFKLGCQLCALCRCLNNIDLFFFRVECIISVTVVVLTSIMCIYRISLLHSFVCNKVVMFISNNCFCMI